MPKVSVITATHNRARYLEEMFDSLLSQRGVDFEHIVIDDGSTDDTRQVIRSFTDPSSHLYDHRVNAYSNPTRRGIISTYIEGVERSTGDFIKVLDDDDMLIGSDSLRKQAGALEANPDVWLVASATRFVDADLHPYKTRRYRKGSEIVDKHELRKRILFYPTSPFPHGSMMFTREAYEELRVFDQELLCEVICSDGKIYYIDEPLFGYRTHKNNITNRLATRIAATREKISHVKRLADNDLEPYVIPLMFYRSIMELGKAAWLQVRSKR